MATDTYFPNRAAYRIYCKSSAFDSKKFGAKLRSGDKRSLLEEQPCHLAAAGNISPLYTPAERIAALLKQPNMFSLI